MTSDAKIGLLLALVFIFIIAFIVNGIPRFNSDKTSNDLTKKILDVRDTPAIGQRERLVNNQVLDNDIRYEMPLSSSSQGLNEGVGQGSLRTDQTQQANLGQEQERIEVIGGPAVQQQEQAAQQVVKKDDAKENILKIENTQAKAPRVYTVVDGDMLATIAKKVYGELEGNRRINVERIYAANGSIMRSPDEVFPGQKLVIPPLPVGSASALETNPLLERAESIGAKHIPAPQTKTGSANTYLVATDDNLWKIAANKLGNGNRYMEIYELNKDILPNEHTVFEGMRLRLPAN